MRFSILTLASLLACAVSVAAKPVEVETFCMYCPNNCTYECPINARCVCPGVLQGSDPNSCPSMDHFLDICSRRSADKKKQANSLQRLSKNAIAARNVRLAQRFCV